MTVYTFDRTLNGLLTAVFDAFALHQKPEQLLGEGDVLPLFCDEIHHVITDEEKARRVWAGLEQRLSPQAVRMLSVSWLSELPALHQPLFQYIYKVFQQPKGSPSIERNFSDPDILAVTNIARRVIHEHWRMKQFIRFQKAKDGTYLGVVSPDHDVLPLVIDHFKDRFGDQPWLIYDARRHYGYYYSPAYSQQEESSQQTNHDTMGRPPVTRVTFESITSLPFDMETGKLNEELLCQDDQLFQELWRTYFKAICIRERMNPRKQAADMPRRYWKYMTEKQGKS